MSIQCDRCTREIPWKFDLQNDHLHTKGSPQHFSQKAVSVSYRRAVWNAKVSVPTLAMVPLINLCEACWRQQANEWTSGGASVYATIPAKTSNSGVYFNNQRLDYLQDGQPDIEKIISTCVHEMSHYWSNMHTGLQSFESSKKIHWDECVTDFLARETYFRIWGAKAYKTSYGTMSEFISKSVTNLKIPTFKQKDVPGFPEPFNILVGNLAAVPKAPIEQALAQRFLTWYLRGDNAQVDGQGITQFLGSPVGQLFFSALSDQSLGYGIPTTLAPRHPKSTQSSNSAKYL